MAKLTFNLPSSTFLRTAALVASFGVLAAGCGGGGGGTKATPPIPLAGLQETDTERVYASNAVQASASKASAPFSLTMDPSTLSIHAIDTMGDLAEKQASAADLWIAILKVTGSGKTFDYDLNFHELDSMPTTPAATGKPHMMEKLSETGDVVFSIGKDSMADKQDMDNFGFSDSYETKILKGEVDTDDTAGNDATVYAEVYTDYEKAKKDNDYLSGGVWMIIPKTKTKQNKYKFGAFADGSKPFAGGVDVAFTGTVHYDGKALGFYRYSKDSQQKISRLTGNVRLTADFGSATAPGSVSGGISSLKLDGTATSGSIDLPSITFAADAMAFASGNGANMGTFDEKAFTGSWTGAFFGPAESDNSVKPASVAGVVQGYSGDSNSFVASFSAHGPETSEQ